MNDANRFLDALSPAVRAAVLTAGTVSTYLPGSVLSRRGDPLSLVHLPYGGAVAEIEDGSDGGSAEVTIVGSEGCSGIEALLEMPLAPFRRLVDVPTRALAVSVPLLLELRDQHVEFHRLIHRYAAARMRGFGISIGCYARHPVTARLARWLLRMHDRVESGDFVLTHQTLALMLGVRRATITRAIHELCASASIASQRNAIRIIDRERLMTLTCSCYRDARGVFDDVYGSSAGIGEIS